MGGGATERKGRQTRVSNGVLGAKTTIGVIAVNCCQILKESTLKNNILIDDLRRIKGINHSLIQ